MNTVTAADMRAAFRGEIYGDGAQMTDVWLADHVARNDVDLARSPRFTEDGELSGAALLAFRDRRAWIGGFGVVPAFRGRGLARRYLADALEIARGAGAASVELEVMTHNEAALAVYRRGGFETVGELLVWSREPLAPAGTAAPVAARIRDVAEIAAFARTEPTCWQREPRTVAASPSAFLTAGDLRRAGAYAFVRCDGADRAIVLDAAAWYDEHGRSDGPALLALLDRLFPDRALLLINEPPQGGLHAALTGSAHWREFVRQFRMRAEL